MAREARDRVGDVVDRHDVDGERRRAGSNG
jgi:hypothetical protein